MKYPRLHQYRLIYLYTCTPEAAVKDNLVFYNLYRKIQILEALPVTASQGQVEHFRKQVYQATQKVINVINNNLKLNTQLQELYLI